MISAREKIGGGAGTRTPDTGIMIPLLYQLSYTAPRKILEAYDTVLRPFCQEKRGIKEVRLV